MQGLPPGSRDRSGSPSPRHRHRPAPAGRRDGVLFAAAGLLMLAVHVLAPQRTGTLVFSQIFEPYLLIAALVGAVVFAVIARVRLATILVIALVVAAALRYGPLAISFPTATPAGAQRLHLMTWNLEAGDVGVDVLADAIVESRPDVVGLVAGANASRNTGSTPIPVSSVFPTRYRSPARVTRSGAFGGLARSSSLCALRTCAPLRLASFAGREVRRSPSSGPSIPAGIAIGRSDSSPASWPPAGTPGSAVRRRSTASSPAGITPCTSMTYVRPIATGPCQAVAAGCMTPTSSPLRPRPRRSARATWRSPVAFVSAAFRQSGLQGAGYRPRLRATRLSMATPNSARLPRAAKPPGSATETPPVPRRANANVRRAQALAARVFS